MRRGESGRGRGKRKSNLRKGERDDRHSHRRKPHNLRPAVVDTPSKPPAQSHETRRLLEGIGTPASAPFKPDPFQLTLAALEFEDVLVTAPTGSGKTWIAREEIRRLMRTDAAPGTRPR